LSAQPAGEPETLVLPVPPGLSASAFYLWFKRIVYTLLVFDVGLLYALGTWREVVEQTGWLLILGSFEVESRGLARLADGRKRLAPLGAELLGYGLALFSWGAYAATAEWLNFANSSVWLLIAAALAYDLHVPGRYGSFEWRLRNIGKTTLYLAISGIALTWGLEGEWLDFWDAMLWLTCFFVIELKVFDFEAARRLRRW
jgi:hypothetical protein